MPILDEIAEAWDEVPPLCVSVAGIYYSLTGGKKEQKRGDPTALRDMLGGSGFSSEAPSWLRTTT